ncbi:hypothetical protein VKT23_014553 [Stygiomarasmius scandens]|uniref:DUF6532 domain-containing protein n=1 Tax=Marasmiellus scandens TaxID=2682957 RepID=A0ABR1J0F5_9AGAR
MSKRRSQDNGDEEGLEDEEYELPQKRRRRTQTAQSGDGRQRSSARNKNNHQESDAAKVIRLEQETQRLQQMLKGASKQTSHYEENDDEDDGGDAESENEPGTIGITFAPPSAITPLQTMPAPIPVPRLDLARVHRRNNPAPVPKIPRNAFLTAPSVDNSDDSGADQNDDTLSSLPLSIPHYRPQHRRSGSSSTHVSITSNHTSESSTVPMSPVTPTVHTKPRLRFSADYVPGKKAKAGDYDSEGIAIILRAAAYYESKIIGAGCFPSRSVQIGWANKAFHDGCCVAEKEYEPDDRVRSIIRGRASRIRGEMYGLVYQAVLSTYGFKSDTTKKAIKHNIDLHFQLMDRMMFAYRVMKKPDPEDFAENPIFQLILRLGIFGSGIESRGIVFSRFFNPVSLETIAFFMTLIRAVINRFSTGIYDKPSQRNGFTEQGNKQYYDEYLEALKTWSGCNEEVVLQIRKRMYKRAREKSRVDPAVPEAVISDAARIHMKVRLSTRTGDTDTEDEDEDEDEDNENRNGNGNSNDASSA